jgi:hypothetical protein
MINVLGKLSKATDLIPKNLVVSLISQYDAFLGNLLAAIYLKKYDLLNNIEKTMTFKELLSFNNIDEAKEFIIEKEIENILRQSHVEQFDTLEKKFNIILKSDLPIWPTFVEFTQRRNLFVHCNGIISSQYLKVCTSHGCIFNDGNKIGTKLEVSADYLASGFNCIYEIGVKLAHVLWRKIFPDEIELADKNLNNIIYNLLIQEKYKLARIFADFACIILKKSSSDIYRRMYIINRAISYKFDGDRDSAIKILKKEDWSASNIVFKLGVQVLNDNFQEASNIMKQIGSENDMINKKGYLDWPLFKEFRKKEIFRNIYKEIYQEDYELFIHDNETIEKIEDTKAD